MISAAQDYQEFSAHIKAVQAKHRQEWEQLQALYEELEMVDLSVPVHRRHLTPA